MRLVWLALGVVAIGTGIVGVALPGLPTTPFLLAGAFAFSRSSPRLESWLIDHPRLGPPIRDWRSQRAISRKAKVAAMATMAATLAAGWLPGLGALLIGVQAAVLSVVAVFIVTRPEPRRGPPDTASWIDRDI